MGVGGGGGGEDGDGLSRRWETIFFIGRRIRMEWKHENENTRKWACNDNNEYVIELVGMRLEIRRRMGDKKNLLEEIEMCYGLTTTFDIGDQISDGVISIFFVNRVQHTSHCIVIAHL